jgi:hypothetical protein
VVSLIEYVVAVERTVLFDDTNFFPSRPMVQLTRFDNLLRRTTMPHYSVMSREELKE